MNSNTDTSLLIADGIKYNPVVPSGDITISNTGVFSISPGVIVNNDISSTASIANTKLANSTISVTDGSSTTAISLGGTITYTGGEGVDITESNGEITISSEDATYTNKGISSFSSSLS